jgi:hypothetical protein
VGVFGYNVFDARSGLGEGKDADVFEFCSEDTAEYIEENELGIKIRTQPNNLIT